MNKILLVVAILATFHTIRIFVAGRKAQREFPATDYLNQSTPNSDLWRWRKPNPEVGLKLQDDDSQSKICWSAEFNMTDYFVSLFGYVSYLAAIIFTVAALKFYLFGSEEDGGRAIAGFFIAGVAFFSGAAALNLRQRVLEIIRTSNGLVLLYSYGAFIKRKIFFPKDSKTIIKVKQQSAADYDSSQKLPFYELTLKKVKWCSFVPVKFYVAANQSQITWLEGGLHECFGSIKAGE